MDELQISGKRFISSRRIAKDNGYTSDYIGQLIRGGKVTGQKVGRAWYVDAISFESYLGEEGQVQQVQPVRPEQQTEVAPEPTQSVVLPTPGKVKEVAEEKIPEPVVVAQKKEESHHVPLHIVRPQAAGGLRYYQDERPSLPEIREIRIEKTEPPIPYQTEEIDNAPGTTAFEPRQARSSGVAGLAMLGAAVFIVSAAVSSFVSLDLSIEAGNAASAAYSLHW